MKRCWDHNPENRPTAGEIWDCLINYYPYDINITEEKKEVIRLAENKRQEILKSEKYLSDKRCYKHHPGSFYTSRLLMNRFNKLNHQIFYLITIVHQ